jgi:hypothetical protein
LGVNFLLKLPLKIFNHVHRLPCELNKFTTCMAKEVEKGESIKVKKKCHGARHFKLNTSEFLFFEQRITNKYLYRTVSELCI